MRQHFTCDKKLGILNKTNASEMYGLTPGTKVTMLYFWFLMAFLGYFSSHFSGCPSHTVRAFSSFLLRHVWTRHSQQLR